MDDIIKLLQQLMSQKPRPKGGIADTAEGVEFLGKTLSKEERGSLMIVNSRLTDASRFEPFSIGNVGRDRRYGLISDYEKSLTDEFNKTVEFLKANPDIRLSQTQKDNIFYNLGVLRRISDEKNKLEKGIIEDGKKPSNVRDMEGNVLDPNEPIIGGTQEGVKVKKMTDVEEAIDNASPGFANDKKYDAQLVAEDLADKRFGKDFYDLTQKQQMDLYDEAYQGLSNPKITPYDSETAAQIGKDIDEAGGMEAFLDANPISDTSTKRYFKGVEIKDPTFDETLPFDNDAEKLAEIKMSNEAYDIEKARGTEPKKFRLNVDKFKEDFNVSDEELQKILALSPEEQQKVLREYIDKDFAQQIELSDFDVTDKEPNAQGGIVGLRI